MKLNILGKQRTGKQAFQLNAEKNEAFAIKAVKYFKRYSPDQTVDLKFFDEIKHIDWQFSGEAVKLTYIDGSTEVVNMAYYDEAKIIAVGLSTGRRMQMPLKDVKVDQYFWFGEVRFKLISRFDSNMEKLLVCTIGKTDKIAFIDPSSLVDAEML